MRRNVVPSGGAQVRYIARRLPRRKQTRSWKSSRSSTRTWGIFVDPSAMANVSMFDGGSTLSVRAMGQSLVSIGQGICLCVLFSFLGLLLCLFGSGRLAGVFLLLGQLDLFLSNVLLGSHDCSGKQTAFIVSSEGNFRSLWLCEGRGVLKSSCRLWEQGHTADCFPRWQAWAGLPRGREHQQTSNINIT